jgi:hypothetical protein
MRRELGIERLERVFGNGERLAGRRVYRMAGREARSTRGWGCLGAGVRGLAFDGGDERFTKIVLQLVLLHVENPWTLIVTR